MAYLGAGNVGLRTRLGYVHNKLKKMGSWGTEPVIPSDCDIVIQFPKDATSVTIEWLAAAIKKSGTGLLIKISRHETTGLTNMLCSCTFQGLVFRNMCSCYCS